METAQTAEKTDQKVGPLPDNLKPSVLPEIAAKLTLGAQVRRQGDQAAVAFEGDVVVMHETDLASAQRVALRLRSTIGRKVTPATVMRLMTDAQRMVSDEIFRPGALRVLYYSVQSKASAFYRCLMPLYALNMSGKAVAHASAGSFGRGAMDYDVVVLQIDNSPSALQFMKSLQAAGKKVIYEIDDAFDALEPWHPQYASYGQPARQEAIRAMISQADAVQVSTQFLADRYRKIAKRIEVVPNMVELAAWPRADRLRKDGRFKVLWAGSPSHSGDLELVVGALGQFARAHPEVMIVFFGQEVRDERIPAGQIETVGFCEFEEYAFTLAAIDADIAIAPIADIPFNHGKSNLRILQYWATGYPTIASRVGPYAESISSGVNGLLVDDEKGWLGALELLYAHKNVARGMSDCGFEAVKKFDVLPHVDRIKEFYSSLIEG